MMAAMPYICIDVEASGPVPPEYSLLSIGATVVRRLPPPSDKYELGEELYIELKPAFPGELAEAMAVHGLKMDDLRRDGVEPREAMQRLRDWTLSLCKNKQDRPIFVGHNAVFDWAYINYYFHHFGVENPFGYKALDTKALAMGVLAISWEATNKETIEKMLPIPKQDTSQAHKADYDAHYQAEILKALMEHPTRKRAPKV
jgi:ribonuclease T